MSETSKKATATGAGATAKTPAPAPAAAATNGGDKHVKFASNTKPPTPVRRYEHGRSMRQKVGKANLSRDLPIFFAIVAFLLYVAWSLGDVGRPPGKGEKKILSIHDIRKELDNVAVEYVRDREDRRRKTDCALFLAESTIPKTGFGWYAGRNYVADDVVLEEGFPLREEVDGHVISQHDLVMKHHPYMFNVKRRDGASGPYVATRAIEQGEELFLPYELHPHSLLGEDHVLFHNIPLANDYELAEAIFIMEVQIQIYGTGKKHITRKIPKRGAVDRSAGGDKALKMVKNAVRMFNRRVANILPHSTNKMKDDFATTRHYSYQIVNNRTVYWLEVEGKCMDDIVVKDGSVYANRAIKKNSLIVVAPLHIARRAERDCDADGEEVKEPPKDLRGACFGHAVAPVLMCPLSSAFNLKYETDKTATTNAKYQWGGWNGLNHQSRYWPADDVIYERATGQTMDIVATGDIAVGEEIILDISDCNVASDSVVELADYHIPKLWRPIANTDDEEAVAASE